MQNIQTLIDLGFKKIPSGEYLFRGKNQKFVANVNETNPPVYVELYKIHPGIDKRKNSPHYGRHFRSKIKDCVSSCSVERAIKHFDQPEESFGYGFGGCFLYTDR